MPKVSFIREKIVKYIDENPLEEGYPPKFFANKKFTSDMNYCRALMMELAEKGTLIKKRFKARNGQMTYRFFSVAQVSENAPIGMTNFISPSVFFNKNVEPSVADIINSKKKQWNKFIIRTRIHRLHGDY